MTSNFPPQEIAPPGSTKTRRLQRAAPATTAPHAQGSYYTWHTEEVELRGGRWLLYSKPGMSWFGGFDFAEALLAEQMDVAPGERVLLCNCGSGMAGVMAAALAGDGPVWWAESNVVAAEAARRTLSANGLDGENVTVVDSNGSSHLPGCPQACPTVDVVAIRLPKGKQAALQLLWDAYQLLVPGGRVFLAGPNSEGIKTYLRHMQALFGNSRQVAFRKGTRVAVAQKMETLPATPAEFQAPWLDHAHFEEFKIDAAGGFYTVCSRPSVFSWNRLDEGTRVLLECLTNDTIAIGAEDAVLDLGCGYGIIGMAAAIRARAGTVQMVDANMVAVEAARRSVAANGLHNCTVQQSDCGAAVRDLRFDVVLTNPPFHQGQPQQYDVAQQFIRDAAAVLKSGGRFYLVANHFLKYEETLEACFGNVQTVYRDSKYKVLSSSKE